MNQMNTQISVRAAQGRYQALNVPVSQLSEAVRPWYQDWTDQKIQEALNDLERPEMRDRAAEFLGLELIPAARDVICLSNVNSVNLIAWRG